MRKATLFSQSPPKASSLPARHQGQRLERLHVNAFTMPKQAAEITDDEQALLAVCGSDSMVTMVKGLWDDIMEKKKLDVSGQGLTDEAVGRLLKGLHMCACR